MTSPTDLAGVPETMLWTLHNRASEARHPQGVIRDPKCIEIHESIPYDYDRSFGAAEPSHGVRSKLFDEAVLDFLNRHPDGVIVNLGEGLETQRFRVTNDDRAVWLSVDVPEAIAARERFIAPDERHLHVAKSALDTAWFEEVPDGRPVFVTAQGLLMYFTEAEVQGLVQALVRRWPGVELMFDHIPRWVSTKTLSPKGWQKTPHYRTPAMPWGLDRPEVLPLLKRWVGEVQDLGSPGFAFPRGLRRVVFGLLGSLPWIRDRTPGITRVRLGASS